MAFMRHGFSTPLLARAVLMLTFVAGFCFISGVAIYEDQVGVMDWHQQHIGKVKHAVFHTQKSGRKRVIVATEENAIASLNLRRGEIFWRHVLAESDIVDDIDLALGKYVVTLSSSGSILRAWNLPDGQMIWESFLEGLGSSKCLLSVPVALKNEKENAILVYSRGWLNAVSSMDGELLWRTDFSAESEETDISIEKILFSPDGESIYAVGFIGKSHVASWTINPLNGKIMKHEVSTFPRGLSLDELIVTEDTLVALDSARSTIITSDIAKGELTLHQTAVSTFFEDSSSEAQLQLLPLKFIGAFALRVNSHILLIKVGDTCSDLHLLEKVSEPAVISDGLPLSPGQQAFAVVQHLGNNKVSLTVLLDNGGKSEVLRETIEQDSQRGTIQKVFINNYMRTDMSYGFRALVVAEDHSLALFQQGVVVWSREDGLASIIDATTLELPLERDGVSVAEVEHNLFEWLKGHLLKLKATLMLASAEDIAVIQEMRLNNAEKTKMTRDHNGFRKLLIVLTKAGKLLALHSGNGRIVWSLLVPTFQKSNECQAPSVLKVFPWQVPHQHALDENPAVLIVGKCGIGPDALGIISVVDSYTGVELESYRLSYSISQVIPLPMTDSTERRLHLLVDRNARAHLFPRTPEALSIFLKQMSNTYLYFVDVEKGSIQGYGIDGHDMSDEVSKDYCFKTRELWSVLFPHDSEQIVATATKKSNEVVHTQAKVLSDQEVLYKYVSKNMLFVATVAPKAAGSIGSATPEEAWLVAYLIDTVTGRVLHRVTHQGVQGPVHAVFSENWVIYHYFNLKAHRYEISVIEIYDQSRANTKNVIELMLGQHNLSTPISSYSYVDVEVKTQSYFFSQSVKTIAVTSTAKGITSKQVLIGTIGDQVLALDKRFFDPRRSLNPTPAEREDGILPLSDAIPIFPQSYITHSLQVEGLRGIITIPATLESTSLVFAYGVDLFYTRTAPSRTYDSLTEEFSYALLLMTIVALVVAIVVMWILSEKKELKEKWR
uniref:ER membrane protein complex subunit 1 n=1 Tax=Araucaria cunninghamii TaxID=56994 RepID=A0A0D6QZZ8_ARACU